MKSPGSFGRPTSCPRIPGALTVLATEADAQGIRIVSTLPIAHSSPDVAVRGGCLSAALAADAVTVSVEAVDIDPDHAYRTRHACRPVARPSRAVDVGSYVRRRIRSCPLVSGSDR